MLSASEPQASEKEEQSGHAPTLAGRYEILTKMRLEELDSPEAPAYAVRNLREARSDLFAVVCDHGLPPRADAFTAVKALEHPAVIPLVDWGVVSWPGSSKRRFVLLFERPGGQRLMAGLSDTREPLSEDQIARSVIQPLISALRELSGRGIHHGQIRPSNLYYRDAVTGGIMLGDFVSGPPSFGQPAVFETIERGMAESAGRGAGTIADDLYALGITILMVALGRNPVKLLDDAEILQSKIERGTFSAMVGNSRLPASLIEPVKGLLSDDPKQRWSLKDLELWVNGRRLSPKQPQVARRAARPMEFNGGEYWHLRTLADALSRSSVSAVHAIDSGELDRWLRRSMGDEERVRAVSEAIASASAFGRTGNFEERLVSRVCMALDPAAPMRYRGRSVMPGGLGPALAYAFRRNDGVQALAEAMAGQLPMFWISMQGDFRPEHVPVVKTYDSLRIVLERAGPGFGIERILYELNPFMPCISPIVDDYYPATVNALLSALDAEAASPNRASEPIDRHIMAFIAARLRRLDEKLLATLNSSVEPGRRATAVLAILAEAQSHHGPTRLPGLAQWIQPLIEPAIDRFRKRSLREKVREAVARAIPNGRLTELLSLIDDVRAVRQDQDGFNHAMTAYHAMSMEVSRLRKEIDDQVSLAQSVGRQLAAVASGIVSAILLFVIVFIMQGA